MTTEVLPVRDKVQLLHAQLSAYNALCEELEARITEEGRVAGAEREAQMDARRHIAALQRTRTAARSCMRRHSGAPETALPRAVVVHRQPYIRDRLAREMAERGISVIGEAEDGAMAVAMAVCEQPEVVVLEDRLPWMPAHEVVDVAHRLAPQTLLAVQVEDPVEGEELVQAGATTVFGRGVRPAEICETILRVLAEQSPELPPAA